MKTKFLTLILISILCFVLGCDSSTVTVPDEELIETKGTVTQADTKFSGKMSDDSGMEYSYNLMKFSQENELNIQVGDTLIIYSQSIKETYPLQFSNIQKYEHIPKE